MPALPSPGRTLGYEYFTAGSAAGKDSSLANTIKQPQVNRDF
jgi:hypothetical protein